jgi:hypothetical protein
MNTYIIYKGLKQRLNALAPCFYFLGQYLKGADNTSYIVPAIYIELPKFMPVDFAPGKIQVAKGVQLKVHLVTNAPFSNSNNQYQENNILEHQAKLDAIDRLMTGFVLKDDKQRLLTQQLVPVAGNNMNYEGVKIYSVITYETDILSYHLKQ